jgi:hypothetical protein
MPHGVRSSLLQQVRKLIGRSATPDQEDSLLLAVRTQAVKDLEERGAFAEPALPRVLAGKPPLETRQRIEQLLEKVQGPITSGEVLRVLRGVQALEQIGTPAAREAFGT